MADNTILNTGTGGDTISTDDLGTVKVQRVKVQYGVDGSATDVSSGSPLPVTDNSLAADGAVGLPTQAAVVAGFDGTNVQAVVTDSAGRLQVGINGAVPVTDNGGSLTVDGTVGVSGTVTVNGSGVTQPVSAASLPLPTGAATSAKQPALGTAGTASADVLTVQGITSMTPLKVDNSANTQPVSGTVTVSNPTTAPETGLAKDATLTGGTQKTKLVDTGGTNVASISAAGALKVDNSGQTQPVSLAAAIAVTDGAGTLTVDAPVGTPVFVTPTPSTTGGWSKIKYAAQTTTVQTPKGTAGTFAGYYVYNPNATVAYVQVFDVATATTVTLGSTAPDMIFGIPATSGANLELTNGVNMVNGIKLACTTTATGSTAPTTGLDLTVWFK